MLRVVFDSTTFRPETFALLEKSQLISLCKSRRILPIYSPLFLEEIINTYGTPGKRKELLNRWLPLIESTTYRITEELPVLFHRELVGGGGLKTNIYIRPKVQKYIFSKFKEASEDGPWNLWESSRTERDLVSDKREIRHSILRSMRSEMDEWRRKAAQRDLNSPPPAFDVFVSNEIDNAGRIFIVRKISARNPHAIADRWSKSKNDYPLFTAYMRGVLYLCYYAITKPNDPLDKNATADLEIMLNLVHGDALVSDETGFMKAAFNDLWKPKGKLFFSVKEFVQSFE